jgi:hypothetical protein
VSRKKCWPISSGVVELFHVGKPCRTISCWAHEHKFEPFPVELSNYFSPPPPAPAEGGSSKKDPKKSSKKSSKFFEKKLEKSSTKRFEWLYCGILHNCGSTKGGRVRGEGGWRIVIPMPEALNCVEGRRQKRVHQRNYVYLVNPNWAPKQSEKIKINGGQNEFLPALVRTYNAGLSFALLFFLLRH